MRLNNYVKNTFTLVGGTRKRMNNKVGKPAVSFELKDTEGRVHRLGQYVSKWLLLVFHRHLG